MFPSTLELSSLNGSNGFALNGIDDDDYSGTSVSSAGDVNGDGIDDLIIGAPDAGPNGTDSGQSYVVFGQDTTPPVSNPGGGSTGGGSTGGGSTDGGSTGGTLAPVSGGGSTGGDSTGGGSTGGGSTDNDPNIFEVSNLGTESSIRFSIGSCPFSRLSTR